MLALSQFTELQRLAAGVLASTALVVAIVGFAAQRTLANLIAGIQIAISQPIRIGDRDQLRRTRGPGHRHHPLLHLHRPRRRQLRGDPQPAPGRRDRPQPLHRRHRRLTASARRKYPLFDDAAHPATPAPPGGNRRQAPDRLRRRLRPARDRGHRRHLLGPRRRRRRPLARQLQTDRPRRQHRRLRRRRLAGWGSSPRREARSLVSIDRIPKSLQLATVAIEDQRFYQHDALDYEGILRAALKNLEAGEAVEGGSTITQQLVRNLCIRNPKRTIERKIIEAQLAIEYAERHSRREILGSYLNVASYGTVEGTTAVGVGAASKIFFSKPVWKLKPAGSGAARRPAAGALRIQPAARPGRAAQSRRNQVLRRWRSSATSAASGRGRRWPAACGVNLDESYFEHREPYFFDYVENQLIEEYGVEHGARAAASRSTPRSTPSCSRSGWKRCAPRCPTRPTPPRRWSRSTRATARSGRWSPAPTTKRASSTSPPRATASRARPSRPSS